MMMMTGDVYDDCDDATLVMMMVTDDATLVMMMVTDDDATLVMVTVMMLL